MWGSSKLVYHQDHNTFVVDLEQPLPGGINLQLEANPDPFQYGLSISVDLHNNRPLTLESFNLELLPDLRGREKMMVNGFQSWSDSSERCAGDRIPSPPRITYTFFGANGDYGFFPYSGRPGRLHSWTYTYFTFPGEEILLLGSLDEDSGYTAFEYDYSANQLIVHKDCQGADSRDGYPLLRLYLGKGRPEEVFDEYFSRLRLPRKPGPRVTGWTSWYNYYTKISEEIVHHNLKELSAMQLPLDYFQLDDGWQEAVGDWLDCNAKFPSGMKALVAKIREQGYRPGLWIAPFICERRSRLLREHPEWLLRDSRGKPVKAGYNPNWSGWYYALDLYAPGFQDYLQRVFQRALEEWGFELLKLDFLYAAALLPRQGKSRGQVMAEAMELLHRLAGEKKLLGCGVPLGPAWGRVDYCRIGSDVTPFWELPLKGLNYRERLSTINSLTSTIGRRHLDRRAFRNDPDVFLLRDGVPGKNRNYLNRNQRYTLFFLNNLLGGLVFFSDNVDGYTEAQKQLLRSAFPSLECDVHRIDQEQGLCRISFTVNGKEYLAYANLSSRRCTVTLPEEMYFNPATFVLSPGRALVLEPYQTVCLYKIEPRENEPYLLGGTGHIFPGAQIEKLDLSGPDITLELYRHSAPGSKIFLAVPPGLNSLRVNGQDLPVIEQENWRYITVSFPGKKV